MGRNMLEAARLHMDDLMQAQGDKRREEGANPMPAKAKAKTTKPPDDEPERPRNTPASASTDIPPQPKASPGNPNECISKSWHTNGSISTSSLMWDDGVRMGH